jgi:hypothetical protein
MIISSLIFFDASFKKGLSILGNVFIFLVLFENGKSNTTPYINQNSSYQLLYCVSIIVPFRYLCYPNELFWTEEGFRFSWRYVDGKAGICYI